MDSLRYRVLDIGWFTPAGVEMSEEDWSVAFAKSLGVFLNGRAIPTPNQRGEPVVDDSFYVVFNAHHEPLTFTLPGGKWGEQWTTVLDTHDAVDHMENGDTALAYGAGAGVRIEPWSLVLLRRIQ